MSGQVPDHGCGLPAGCSRDDLLGTMRAFTRMWRGLTAGLDETLLATPGPGDMRSVHDDLVAAGLAVATAGRTARAALGAEQSSAGGGEPPAWPDAAPATVRAAITMLDRAVAGLNAVATRAGDGGWGSVVAIVEAAVHDGVHHLHDAGRRLHASGLGAPSRTGRVVQVNASGGGVPKSPVAAGVIGRGGLAGDHQAERRIHGRPHQALSLWSAEVVEALRAEGHSVFPGAAGENLTLGGVDWGAIRPGVRITVGTATVEASDFATPCAKNARWFTGGDIDRIDHRRHPGWSRVYAWVLRPGEVRPGDDALVEPGVTPPP